MRHHRYSNIALSGVATAMFYSGGDYDYAIVFAILFGLSLGDLLTWKGWFV